MKVKILRQQHPGAEPYWETFGVDVSDDMTIAGLIDHINYNDDMVDIDGKPTTRIAWECSCLQGVCGSCAMVINNVPALACETFIRNLKGDVITIQPLKKFMTIKDLLTDRSVIFQNLMKTNMFIEENNPDEKGSHLQQYSVAKCLKCGLCLEVCPNYVGGGSFYGASFANDCYLVSTRNKSKKQEMKEVYKEHFGNGCSKDMSCSRVCPMNIETIASMARLNRGL